MRFSLLNPWQTLTSTKNNKVLVCTMASTCEMPHCHLFHMGFISSSQKVFVVWILLTLHELWPPEKKNAVLFINLENMSIQSNFSQSKFPILKYYVYKHYNQNHASTLAIKHAYTAHIIINRCKEPIR